MLQKLRGNNQKGFTLIELMIVIAIISAAILKRMPRTSWQPWLLIFPNRNTPRHQQLLSYRASRV
jgi:prepilin-type N-terminal cleavage/methylation domain-containing protein